MKNIVLMMFLGVVVLCIHSCGTSGPGIFAKKTAHEQYGDKLNSAGLKNTALGQKWFEEAGRSLNQPLSVTIPYKEVGYFDAAEPGAVGLRFPARRGEMIRIELDKKPAEGFIVFMDFWEASSGVGNKPKLIQSTDSSSLRIEYEVRKEGEYQLRLQPELLKGGQYTLEIAAGPSLAYPIKASGTNHIKSFWGANRDGGSRSHEGIDMFAPRNTPVVAAAPGIVTRVNENNLGGKVVWMRPTGKDYTLYYAHLDSQIVRDGQRVKTGDTLGLMGNTGNARTTAPHLHFGIYTNGGAVDPLPFVNPKLAKPENSRLSLERLGEIGRTSNKTMLFFSTTQKAGASMELPSSTLVKISAAVSNFYKVGLPDGSYGFISGNSINPATKQIRELKFKESKKIFNAPDSIAPVKAVVNVGDPVEVLANFNDYYYIRTNNQTGWISRGE